jgi:hypothetical protein
MTIFLIGCGRIAFDATPPGAIPIDAAAPDAARSSLADGMPCATQVLLDSGGHLPHDVITWVNDASGDWVVGVEHMSQDVHEIHRHAITAQPTGLVAGAAQLILAVDHVDVLSFEPVAAGYVLGYNEFVLQTAQTLLLTPEMVSIGSHPLGMLAAGNPPLARAGNGGLAMIGLTSGNLEVVPVGEDGAPIGAPSYLATPADGAGHPTMVALDDGLAAVWDSAKTGTCRLAKLRADLSIAAGPVDMAVSGCSDPHVAWLPGSRRIIVVADDVPNGSISGTVWDANLASITPPTTLAPSAHWARIAGDANGAWLAWAENDTVQKVRSARLAADGRVMMMNTAVGELDNSLGHYHTVQHVGQSTVVMWTDAVQGRTFSAMRLCP